MSTFAELVASRKSWIEEVLKTWCLTADRKNLRLAELEWVDIAGKVAPEMSLWSWAWSRFPNLVHDGLPGINETVEVAVQLRDGRSFTGYPDARESTGGTLVLIGSNSAPHGPFSIDEIAGVERV